MVEHTDVGQADRAIFILHQLGRRPRHLMMSLHVLYLFVTSRPFLYLTLGPLMLMCLCTLHLIWVYLLSYLRCHCVF